TMTSRVGTWSFSKSGKRVPPEGRQSAAGDRGRPPRALVRLPDEEGSDLAFGDVVELVPDGAHESVLPRFQLHPEDRGVSGQQVGSTLEEGVVAYDEPVLGGTGVDDVKFYGSGGNFVPGHLDLIFPYPGADCALAFGLGEGQQGSVRGTFRDLGRRSRR